MTLTKMLAGIAAAMPMLACAAPAKPAATPATPPVVFSQERYVSCGAYAGVALLAAADMQARGVSAKSALVASGNPISPGLIALTEFAASAQQARAAGSKEGSAHLGVFLAGICYSRSDLPTIAAK
ncbi:hypothetical protein SAMN05216345_10116 [Cupriavidus sp. YR651]|uniref:hypothetical protein n=1 Tax=Cupriavidus sp. YR651 TaxID=1855315 RepID=UPI00088D9EAA|nr:hypothetical protein [Cupriavidus sp. YR651]SDB97986.1 hypothetical protein SAMN05216345_10116 [Cupriavidus sp. YR651]